MLKDLLAVIGAGCVGSAVLLWIGICYSEWHERRRTR